MTKRIILFLALTACAWSQPTMPFAMWKSAAAGPSFPYNVDSLVVRLDASSITGKSSGDTVHYWPDISGYAHHGWQLTAAAKPIYYADSMRGHPAVFFDGAGDFMAIDTSDLTQKVGGITVYYVIRDTAKASSSGWKMTNGPGYGTASGWYHSGSDITIYDMAPVTKFRQIAVPAQTYAMLVRCTAYGDSLLNEGTGLASRIAIANATGLPARLAGPFYIGRYASGYSSALVSEFLVYRGKHGYNLRQRIIESLRAKYGG